jgi:polyphosphate kinase
MSEIDLHRPDLYFNREFSLLEFNRRVLEQAKDTEVPLLERLRFLCIAGSNLDEFFEVRVAGLRQQRAFGSVQRGPDNLSPAEQLDRISDIARGLIDEQYVVLNEMLIPSLASEGIRFLKRDDWNPRQAHWLKLYFKRELMPIITPVGLDPAHPFPKVLNKGLSFLVTLEGKDAFGRNSGRAVVQVPRSLPRVIRLPEHCAEAPYDLVFLSSVLHAHVDSLFPGMQVTGCYQFRVTRDSDLFVDEEEVDDLLRALQGELPSRRFGDEVRLELTEEAPTEEEKFLAQQFGLDAQDIFRCAGPVNLMRLAAVPDLIDRPDLKYQGFTPGFPARLRPGADIFEAIRKGDILVHHPFQSFAPVIDLLQQAARDPQVLSIRLTLYRTGTESAVVRALTEAAGNGKDVTVVIELRARFDEAANIELASVLQEAGAQVVYGVVGLKTHAKMMLIVRREGRSLRRYLHLGTGNYHASTARLYTDYGMFSCDPALAEDVHRVFQQLTAMGRAGRLKRLYQSPFTLHKGMLELIEHEIALAGQGRPARIMAKMNSLIEPQIIRALYRASQAGVRVDLIVRGICALRPGVKGVSDNITVRSIIGRFLEHTRVFYFENDGEPRVLLSSADWMGRNFFNRVEVCFPVDDRRLRKRVIKEAFNLYLSDNCQAWVLQPDGSYRRTRTSGQSKRRSAQEALLAQLADT